MIVLQQPVWLWGLLALAVPLAIHLLHATSGRPVQFPGQRFVEESPARRVRSLHLRQPWLLLLRLLIFSLLVLALADPRWVESPSPRAGRAHWVTPMALQAGGPGLAAQLKNETAAALVRPGLPGLDSSLESSLKEEAFSPEPAGERLGQLLAADRPQPTALTVTDHPLDRPWRLGETGPQTVQEIPWAGAPLKVALSVAPDRAEDARFLRAALAALASEGRLVWQEAPGDDSVDILIRLGAGVGQGEPAHGLRLLDAAVADAMQASFTLGEEHFTLAATPPGEGMTLLAAGAKGEGGSADAAAVLSLTPGAVPTLRFHSRFHPDWTSLVLSGVFPDVLADWLALFKTMPQALASPAPEAPLRWLAWVIAGLWLLERLLARRRREAAAHA